MGTWAWQAHIPGTPIPTGNPPSGIAAGYVFFDIAAIALSPWILTTWERWRGEPVLAAETGIVAERQAEPATVPATPVAESSG